MDNALRIRTLRWTERQAIAGVVAAALYPGCLGEWLVPDAAQRLRVLTAVGEIWVEHALFFGDIHVTDDLTAATVGLHRLRPLPPPANYPSRLADAAGPYLQRFRTLDAVLEAHRPADAHHHLAVLATAPQDAAGLDEVMLTHYLTRIDRTDMPAWAEVTVRNQDLFTRHGYRPQTPIRLPDGPTLLGMHRPAGSSRRWPTNPTHAGTPPGPPAASPSAATAR
ncbi:hypothetical protein FHX75_111397 [Micromonospora palomenae]|uniref:N-acetyltransferase domain-containing protein n=1 Tax=Micromonospora palomenae TaxID=1461247 RepID=A0A561WWK0_9ACTN|nr:hypothetical protein [Micromonospora palomenae]TWG28246.1 hypothetical protein FHX75_111397 [Micromonospora palomenae]